MGRLKYYKWHLIQIRCPEDKVDSFRLLLRRNSSELPNLVCDFTLIVIGIHRLPNRNAPAVQRLCLYHSPLM